MKDASKTTKKVCRGVIGAQNASTNGGDAFGGSVLMIAFDGGVWCLKKRKL